MLLESRLLRSIKLRQSNIILRSELASFGSKSQLTEVLNILVRKQILIKISMGVYAKTKISSVTGKVIPAGSLETLAPEVLKKLKIKASPGKTAIENSTGRSTQLPGKLVANTGSRRISRKIEIGGRRLYYENDFK